MALAFAVLEATDDASALGLVLVGAHGAAGRLLLLGGVIADRLPRNAVMVGANALSGLAQLGAGALVIHGSFEVWQLAALAAANGVASAFFFPASQGIVPETVSESRLQQANVLLRLGTNAAFIAGPAAGGLAVAAVGAGWALAFDGATYLVSAAILVRMRLPARVRAAATSMLARAARRVDGVPLAHLALGDRARVRVPQRGAQRVASTCSARSSRSASWEARRPTG